MCGRAVLLCHTHIKTPPTPDLEFEIQASSVALFPQRRTSTPLCFSSSRSIPATILLGGNPAIDWHPVQGGEAILLGMLHAKETGISSGHYWAFGSGALLPLPNTARNGSWLAEYLLQPIRSTILSCVANVISMEFLHSFLWSHFAGNQPVASQNVGCFLRLIRERALLHLCQRDYFESCLISFFIF